MHFAITTSYPTLATLDAGRQPLSHIPVNTPPSSKSKRSVGNMEHVADDVFCPQAISTPKKLPFNRADASDDEDIPLALVMKLQSASLAKPSSTVNRVEAIRRPAVEVDDDEDVPLIKLKERRNKFDLRPIIKRVVRRRQPPPSSKPKKFVQTVRDLGPRSTAMMCVVPDCPYDWHVHRKW